MIQGVEELDASYGSGTEEEIDNEKSSILSPSVGPSRLSLNRRRN